MTLQTNDNQITRPYVADRKATKRHRGLLVRYQAIKGSLGKDFSIRVLLFFVFFGLIWAGAVRHPHVGHAVPGSGSASVEKTRVAVARLGAPSSSMTTIVLGWPGGLSVSIGT